jgi:predicted XRE-type DNA-binding protein
MSRKNIFAAMGFEPEDAMVYAIRSDLADAIARFLDESGIRGAEAVERLGLPQGTVSNLKNGKIEHLSIERLMRAMIRAGIPGYAKWPTAELAKAGVLTESRSSATVAGTADILIDVESWEQPLPVTPFEPVGDEAH